MPDNIIFNALYVIETYTKKSFATAFKNDKDIYLVKKLIDMIQSPPLSMAKDKVKKYRMRVLPVLICVLSRCFAYRSRL
jgi:hypothetical protein